MCMALFVVRVGPCQCPAELEPFEAGTNKRARYWLENHLPRYALGFLFVFRTLRCCHRIIGVGQPCVPLRKWEAGRERTADQSSRAVVDSESAMETMAAMAPSSSRIVHHVEPVIAVLNKKITAIRGGHCSFLSLSLSPSVLLLVHTHTTCL